ncbi:hypothetical protein JVU11DRAFT_2269 [Chiua virens]|nr:hypothetical protein JVU11DRAFT_2269 [Chiua virens]
MSLYTSLRVSPRKKRVCSSSDEESTPKRPRIASVLLLLLPYCHLLLLVPLKNLHVPCQHTFHDLKPYIPPSNTPFLTPSQHVRSPLPSRPASSTISSTTSPLPPTQDLQLNLTRTISDVSAGSGNGILRSFRPWLLPLPRLTMIPIRS